MKQPIPPKLLESIEKMISNPLIGISIVDLDTLKKFVTFSNYDTIIQKYGSIEDFINSIGNDGHKRVRVIEYKKNGTGRQNLGVEYDLKFGSENSPKPEEKPAVETTAAPAPAAPIPAVPYYPQMAGPTHDFSMNAANAAIAKVYNYDKLEAERDKLLLKVEMLTEDKMRLEKELLKNEMGLEAKKLASENQNALVNAFGPSLAAIVLNKVAPQATIPSMATEAVSMASPKISEMKQWAFQKLQTLNDDQAETIGLIMGAMAASEEIELAVMELVERFKLNQQ